MGVQPAQSDIRLAFRPKGAATQQGFIAGIELGLDEHQPAEAVNGAGVIELHARLAPTVRRACALIDGPFAGEQDDADKHAGETERQAADEEDQAANTGADGQWTGFGHRATRFRAI